MEKFACTLEELFQEKISLYNEIKMVLEQEKNHLADIDVDSLWKTADRKNQLVSEIEGIRIRILSILEENGIFVNKGTDPFNLFQIIDSLPVPEKEKAGLKKAAIRLDILKQDLATLASENKRYVNESLSVINGIFSTITGFDNKKQYAKNGMASAGAPEKYLIKTRI